MKVFLALPLMLTAFVISNAHADCTTYRIGINTQALSGVNGRLGLELTNAGHEIGQEDDKVVITNYKHTAIFDDADTFGGWDQAGGVMVDPDCYFICGGQTWIYSDIGFCNGLSVDFSSLGTYINFWVNFVDNADNSMFPSQFAVFFTGFRYFPIVQTNDPFGTNSLFTITSQPGCAELTVYSPASFIAPDSIYVDLGGITTVTPLPQELHLRVLNAGPNPSHGLVSVAYVAPAGHISFRIFDVQGRQVFEEHRDQAEAGEGFWRWNANESAGGRVGYGVYFLQISDRERSIVRKMTISR